VKRFSAFRPPLSAREFEQGGDEAGRPHRDRPEEIAAHSLRAGFVSTCVETNAPLIKIAEVTRHKSLSMLQVYNRRHNLFAGRAAAGWV